REENPTLGQSIDKVLQHFGAQIVGNQVFDANQTGIFHAITRMIQDFLGITVPILGTVRASRRIRESVNLRKPMMLGPRDDDSRAFEQMAEALLAEDVAIDDLLTDDSGPHIVGAPPELATEEVFDKTPVTAPHARPAVAPPVPTAPAEIGEVASPVDPAAAPARAPAPPLIDPYMRRSPRFEVDWQASLHGPDGIHSVRVFEVSYGGAVVQTPLSLDIGDVRTLVFEQLPMQPRVEVVVSRRATLGFVVEGEIPPAVMNVAAPPATSVRRMAG
ncbi:MAG TPA: hypothetical protein VGP64_04400, partial [Polyangia bacterium]